ncbi:Heat stress transcription factor A-4b-like protein [Drosera capensis]
MELAESMTCAESPTLSCTQHNVDIPSDPSRIDMNIEPSALVTASGPEALPSKEKEEGAMTAPVTAPAARQGVNDVFWEQLLTENPGSSDTLEVQSARKELDVRDKDGNAIDQNNELTIAFGRPGLETLSGWSGGAIAAASKPLVVPCASIWLLAVGGQLVAPNC